MAKIKFKKIIFTACIGFLFLIANNTSAVESFYSSLGSGQSSSISGLTGAINTSDATLQGITSKSMAQEAINWLKSFAQNKLWNETIPKAASSAFGAALRTALNTIAYDTATWIGSGGKGQKPLFITEDWGTYLTNVADNAGGVFIENLSKEYGTNLCSPNLDVRVKIGLGLVQFVRPSTPSCTFTKMLDNWENELQSENFLSNFQDMFNPTSNDLGIALTLNSKMLAEIANQEDRAKLPLIANNGWLDIRDIGGKAKSTPEEAKRQLQQAGDLYVDGLAKFTGDAFVDAANIFLNQLALTAFNKLLTDLDADNTSSSYSGDYGGLSNANAQKSLGASGLKDKLRKLTEPSFKTRGDYSILAELASCPNPTKAGPTNCVITEKFRQAISEKKTVGKAMQEGYLNAAGIFGFTIGNSLEPSYNDENYPYRSMIILRKYRILPVGWELAAQYIKENSGVGTKNLGDLVACFDPNDEYDGYNDNWCRGLVDPNWVLKAPANYCKREGSGPEILNEQVVGQGSDSELVVARNENYCADEQSCIKENKDGSCQLYGYCTEERRKWDSGADTCEPRNNTCQTFRADDGSTASYLENTLDYTGCSVDNAGCKAYSLTGAYATTTSSVQWSTAGLVYFDNDMKTCSEDGEGCHELIRVNSGTNLFVNSSFEDSTAGTFWDGLASSSDAFDGAKSLELSGDFSKDFTVGTSGYAVGGNPFTFSFFAKDCGFSGEIGLGSATSSLVTSDVWNRYAVSYLFPASVLGNTVPISISNITAGCKIDAAKLELGESASDYDDYRESGVIYQKMLPKYLEDVCYENPGIDYNLKDGAPSVCNDFARECNASDEGCEMYTSVSDGTRVPAKAVIQDYCPGECVGFDTYIQSESAFDSLRDSYFIPSTAQSCSAEAVGCDQFTNLDKVSKGGEGTEYYSYLRQCIKPDASQCSDFYTWEGSDETGFQLKVVKLKKDGENPAVIADDSLECSEAIYNLPPTDPSYNSDCRQFYNTSGTISYHLMSYTVSCSDNCYPFRRTEVNTDPQITSSATCGALCSDASSDGGDKCWDDKGDADSTNDECIVCKNGGTWDQQAKACVYMAIPEEGIKCAANNNGCREYSGNTGNNVKIILNNDFEGSVQGWSGGSLSNEALMAGGNSLYISSAAAVAANSRIASTTVGYMVSEGKSYNLKFLAKPSVSNGFSEINSIELINSDGNSSVFMVGLAKKSDGWQIYEVNLPKLDHVINDSERLEVKANGNIFIDDLRLTEISDRYYLIKSSWNTPDSCNQDAYGNPYALYMLGCDAYNDRDNRTHYLHSFSNLCQESAVGCELMIDTQNSNGYAADVSYSIPADEYIYAIYDKDKQCNANDKGCSLAGESYQYDGTSIFGNVYLKNNPDDYNSIMCSSESVGCEEWSTDSGVSYFKDPGDEVCEWRQKEGEANYDWYRKKVKRCNGTGGVCLSDSNCLSGEACKTETADVKCHSTYFKTIGYGGNGNAVSQPDGWAGTCSASDSGCTELIDPVSKAETNIVFNADFSQDVDGNGIPDGWEEEVGPVDRITQDIVLEPNTLYILAINGSTEVVVSSGSLYELDSNNNFSAGSATISVWSDASNNRASKLFYTSSDVSSARIRVVSDETMEKVELKKALIDYVLDEGFDKTSCNGLVNFEDGCVLFNERSKNGSGFSSLKYDADLTVDDGSGVSPETGAAAARDANVILKVNPDRVCDKWLACRSMAVVENNGKKENVCFDIGLCNSTDENGNCNGFAVTAGDAQEQVSDLGGSSEFGNVSGYSKVGYSYVSEWNMKGDYKLGDMDQKGEIAKFSNSGFEFYGSNYYPLGWTAYDLDNNAVKWESYIFKVINNPIDAQAEGVGYAPEGSSFLKMGSGYKAESEYVEVIEGEEYILTVNINTKNLSSGSVDLIVSSPSGSISLTPNINVGSGNDWVFKLGKFTATESLIKIIIKTEDGSLGNYYIDDIKLRPAIEVRSSWYVPQSCRLYPESDSLACEYYNDSGLYKKGWYGYCLEYDRYPGDPNTCLMWWPVEKIKGDGIEEGAGYSGRVPLYYCAEAVQFRPVEKRKIESVVTVNAGDCGCVGDPPCPSGYTPSHWDDCGDCGGGGDEPGGWRCTASGVQYLVDSLNPDYAWYDYNGSILPATTIGGAGYFGGMSLDIPAESGVKFYDSETGKIYDDYFGYCKRFVQVVTPVGENKFWSGKVYEGSSYKVPSLEYIYETGYKPFGGAVPPDPIDNPYEWDGEDLESDSTVQPIFIRSYVSASDYANSINAGSPYNFIPISGATVSPAVGLCSISRTICLGSAIAGTQFACPSTETCQSFPIINNIASSTSLISRLFSQGYGSWVWDTTQDKYVRDDAYIWNPPSILCNGSGVGPRPAYPNDNCVILPTITNIKIGGSDVDYKLSKNGFVNLTFNTNIDGQQLPLVMYAIDWGDNENTTVSGVEMRNRQNTENPFSLYHLYDYWDLKAKDASGLGNVTCGTDAGGNYCETTPRIKIRDNWGWCNGGTAINDCDQWTDFGGVIRVYEK